MKRIFLSVSYTHLDVYKRQARRGTHLRPPDGARNAETDRTPRIRNPQTLTEKPPHHDPTLVENPETRLRPLLFGRQLETDHLALDVYKRQPQTLRMMHLNSQD